MELYCTLTIVAYPFDCKCLELLNACIFSLVFYVLNARDRNESKYPSIVFLGIEKKSSAWLIFYPKRLRNTRFVL